MSEKEIPLSPQQVTALQQIRRRLHSELPVVGLTLFGSVVRGEADDESDIDLLVLTARPLSRTERHQITDVVFQANLEYGTNFSTVVVDIRSWQEGPVSVLAIRESVDSEGIPL